MVVVIIVLGVVVQLVYVGYAIELVAVLYLAGVQVIREQVKHGTLYAIYVLKLPLHVPVLVEQRIETLEPLGYFVDHVNVFLGLNARDGVLWLYEVLHFDPEHLTPFRVRN